MEIINSLKEWEEKYGPVKDDTKNKIKLMLENGLVSHLSKDKEVYIMEVAESVYRNSANIERQRINNKKSIDNFAKSMQELAYVTEQYLLFLLLIFHLNN